MIMNYWYEGTLSNGKMSKSVAAGYQSWATQKQKCYNPNNPDYKYCGAKGMTVTYSSREFVGWWLHSLKTFKGITPTCGRINHEKGYSFDNIEMQDRSENTREMCFRVKIGTKRKKPIIALLEGAVIGVFPSIVEAGDFFGIKNSMAEKMLYKNRPGSKYGITFEFSREGNKNGNY